MTGDRNSPPPDSGDADDAARDPSGEHAAGAGTDDLDALDLEIEELEEIESVDDSRETVETSGTALPPAVNPSGLPPREPFSPAHSPVAPPVRGADDAGEDPSAPPPAETLESPWEAASAASSLAATGALDTWRVRAELWEHEARHAPSPLQRAQGLVAASECWAMVGDGAHAKQLVRTALELAPTLEVAQVQARQLAHSAKEWDAVLQGMELQSAAGSTKAARAHALSYCADLCRISLGKPEIAKRHTYAAAEVGPEDARASVVALCDDLARHAAAPRAILPQQKWSAEVEPLREELKNLREPHSLAPEGSSVAALLRAASKALTDRRTDRAAQLLSTLTASPELREPALWLAACLAAPMRESRDIALECLKELLDSPSAASARAALVSRALEQQSAHALDVALSAAVEGKSVPPLDRLALHALAGDAATAADLRTLRQDPFSDTPLQRAIALALDPAAGDTDDTDAGRLFALGRVAGLGAHGDELTARPELHDPSSPQLRQLASAMAVEGAVATGNSARLVSALSAWSELSEGHAGAMAALEALLHEMSGDTELAKEHYARALQDPSMAFAATSALVSLGPPEQSIAALLSLARTAEDPVAEALHRAHAATLAARGGSSDTDELIEAAATNASELPFAALLGEWAARRRGAPAEVAAWLSRVRDQAEPTIEKPVSLLREAAELVATDASACTLLLEESHATAPTELTSRLLHESLEDSSPSDRATWREEVASALEDVDLRRVLYTEAAFLYEQAAEHEDAQRAALVLTELPGGGTPLERAFNTNVAKRHEVLSDPSRVTRATTPPPSGLPENDQDPTWLGIAQHLEWQAMESGDLGKLLSVTDDLATHLPPEDARVPAFFSTVGKLGQAEPSRALRWLGPLLSLQPPPPWVLRYALEYASAEKEWAVVLGACRHLLAADLGDSDRAALAFTAGRAALALERNDEARTFLEQTLRDSDRHVGAVEALVEVHERAEDYRSAADTLMHLASVSSVTEVEVDALLKAATLYEGRLKDLPATQKALEAAVDIDITNAQAFGRLVRLYRTLPAPLELMRVYQARIDVESTDEARAHWEHQRDRVLGADGGGNDMRAVLEDRLRQAPDDTRALEGLASLALARGDVRSAEQAWIRLAKIAPGEPIQIKAYERLGHLYEHVLKNPERAMACYRELVGVSPEDLGLWRKLVGAALAADNVIAALKAQTGLVNHCAHVPEKRREVIALAEMYEKQAGDAQRAEASLEKARAAWPYAGEVLQALYGLLGRQQATHRARELLREARKSVLRALETRSAEPDALGLLEAVARLQGDDELQAVYAEAFAAVGGRETPPALVAPMAARAVSRSAERLLAPPGIAPAFLRLLAETGSAISSALPPPADLGAASELQDNALFLRAQAICRAFGLPDAKLVVLKNVQRPAMVLSTDPLVVAVLPRLVTASPVLQDYCLVRCLKLAAIGAAALDACPAPAARATLSLVLEKYGVETKDDVGEEDKAPLRDGLARALPRMSESLAELAAEAATTMDGHLDSLQTELARLAHRTAFAWGGTLATALDAASLEDLVHPAPAEPRERWEWIMGHPTVWDLVVFAAGDSYPLVRQS